MLRRKSNIPNVMKLNGTVLESFPLQEVDNLRIQQGSDLANTIHPLRIGCILVGLSSTALAVKTSETILKLRCRSRTTPADKRLICHFCHC